MRKRISTLFVAVLAIMGVTSASAQITPSVLQNQSRHGVNEGYRINKLKLGENAGLFQIAISGYPDSVLVLNDDLELQVIDLSQTYPTGVSLANTLWCVKVESESQNQTPKYNFLNKGTGADLTIAVKGTDLEGLAQDVLSTVVPREVGGEVYGWSFYAQYLTATGSGKMYSSFKTDSVIGFVVQNGGDVHLMKTGFARAETVDYTQFELRAARSLRLNADQINTILGDQDEKEGVQLKFDPDVVGSSLENPFNAKKFFAQDVTYTGDTTVYVFRADSSYLKVDTAYTNQSGIPFLTYKWDNLNKKSRKNYNSPQDSIVNTSLRDQYRFSFVYSPTYDSLYIQVAQVYVKPDDVTYWRQALTATNLRTWPYVSIQDLVRDEVHIITLYNEQNAHISFGYNGCAPMESNYTSLEGVYVITDGKGKYLAAPIYYYDNYAYTGNTPYFRYEWIEVDLEGQDPSHMPAYQWVVLKTRTADILVPSSPVNLYNREYAWDGTENVAAFSAVQLNKKEGSNYYYISNAVNQLANVDSLQFIEVGKELISDKYLGYKYIPTDSLYTSKYVFKYFNPYTMNEYLRKGDDKDSLLYAKGGKTAFILRNALEQDFSYDPSYKYGFQASDDIRARIDGLVSSLVRTPYHISLKKDVNYTYDNEQKYGVGEHTYRGDSIYVFFKENNHYDGNHYYTFVEAERSLNNNEWSNTGRLGWSKGGVSDTDLSAVLRRETLTENRTSSFTVQQDDSSLYRRFNSADEGVDKDTTVILEFFEAYRGEVLQIEGNVNVHSKEMQGKIDFLGINDKSKAPSGTAFIVDTAWINGGLGHVKPQYLISIEQKQFAGQEADSCHLDHAHLGGITAWTCPHATPAISSFKVGKYLVNFAGFYGTGEDKEMAEETYWEKDEDYMWADYYDRAGFLHAIHIPDSGILIVLNPEKYPYYDAKPEDINPDVLIADEDNRVVDLTGDHHKYVTWSMRYLDPETALEEGGNKQFLFESMKQEDDYDIAPENAQWLKMQNMVITLSVPETSTFEEFSLGDDALIFDVNVGKASDVATDNEQAPSVAGVVVIAGNGEVTIKNANGKKVAISNVLGQTVANTVLTSDNATIAAPQGVVVVAVEGEKAVKAVVK